MKSPTLKEPQADNILPEKKVISCEREPEARKGMVGTIQKVETLFAHIQWEDGEVSVIPLNRIHSNKMGIYGYWLEKENDS